MQHTSLRMGKVISILSCSFVSLSRLPSSHYQNSQYPSSLRCNTLLWGWGKVISILSCSFVSLSRLLLNVFILSISFITSVHFLSCPLGYILVLQHDFRSYSLARMIRQCISQLFIQIPVTIITLCIIATMTINLLQTFRSNISFYNVLQNACLWFGIDAIFQYCYN